MNRREFLGATRALAALAGAGSAGTWTRAAAQQRLEAGTLLDVAPLGNVTLIHLTDLHAQLVPMHYREPSVDVGVGAAAGLPPHLTGAEALASYGLAPGSREAHALTSEDFAALARAYGKMGGLDRIGTVVDRIRAEREGRTLLLDGGDSWQGSYTALKTRGQDVVDAMTLLKPDAMTGHWEFTYGADRVREIVASLPFPFLAGNVVDAEWEEPAFEQTRMFERGGVRIAVIGQAFPYTPIAHPRRLVPDWSFGLREASLAAAVEAARAGGAGLVVLLSHNGFEVDRKLAARVPGLDVILTGHTHDALPEPVVVGRTLLIASGSHGKFVSRLDLDVQGGTVRGYRYRLIPVFADVIEPDGAIAATVARLRAPFEAELARELARTETLLYRRGTFNGTFDDLICQALLEGREADIALSPGFRWGTAVLPGAAITVEDLHAACAMTYPAVYRTTMSGQAIRGVLEDVADNLFHADPYYRQGGDMVRVGGMGYVIDPSAPIGRRISGMTLLASGQPVEAAGDYVVAGWASVADDIEGPPVWEVVEQHLARHPVVRIEPNRSVRVAG